MNSKEFLNKIIVFSKEQINYYENKISEDEKYPSLQQCHQEELISTQEGLNHFLKIKQDLDQLEQLEKQNKRWAEKYTFVEKELIQTKKNFRNSQTHSKNCYKKLKEKYEKLEKAYKNNEVMVRDLNELITRNLELKDELKKSQETISAWMENHKKLIIDNGKMKKVIKGLNEYFDFETDEETETIYCCLGDVTGIDIVFLRKLKEVLQDE